MDVVTGVTICTAVESENRIYSPDSLEVLTSGVLHFSLKVSRHSWETSRYTEYYLHTVRPKH